MHATAIIVTFGVVIAASLFAAPRRATVDGLFGGLSASGRNTRASFWAPGRRSFRPGFSWR